jgi:Tol biopolymer transport system component
MYFGRAGMKADFLRGLVSGVVLVLAGGSCVTDDDPISEVRNDDAERLTFSSVGESAQNPTFSPDGNYVLFTRFKEGYNDPPSELVKINIGTGEETVVIAAPGDAENINSPGSSWVGDRICWSSDMAGGTNEIYTANDDGSSVVQVTDHPESEGYYIEPVFNPADTDKIVFEYGASDQSPHHIAIVEVDENSRVTVLTQDPNCDDRLPDWSSDGRKILFQRADTGSENWQIYTAEVNYSSGSPVLENITKLQQPAAADTDNSWYCNDEYVLSSTSFSSAMPNIFLLPVDGSDPLRVTSTDTREDGAPSCSPDGSRIAFETHYGADEEYPSEIWIIEVE